ncbi:MAG: hypothetical protein M8357_09530 [Desulfobulbaceae bacterium]|nr:hypothetical protein [Desulfobulbaceae bacterium]
MSGAERKGGYRRRNKKGYTCHCCREQKAFCWSCNCGFEICPECFAENKWGISNGPTWICPDCERVHRIE